MAIHPPKDKIDAAAAAAERAVPVVTLELGLQTGRAVTLAVPIDLNGPEAIDLIAIIARDLPKALAEAIQQMRGPNIVVPGGLVIPTRARPV